MAMMEGVKVGLAMIEGREGWRFREFGTALRLWKQLKVIGKANIVMMIMIACDGCLKVKIMPISRPAIGLRMMRIMIMRKIS